MRRLRCVQSAFIAASIFLFLLLTACGGHKPPGSSPFPAKITLTPGVSASMELGSTLVFVASAQNSADTNISPTFTYSSSNPGIVDIAPNGVACAGSWNAPSYNVCSPASGGVASITASALGGTSPPTMVFVHPPIDNIQVSVVPPVNSPPLACPTQTSLPPACELKFNNAGNYCLSQNQVQTLQATAYSKGVDITASVGPFTWTPANFNVVTITPIISSSANVPTNQATMVSNTPGATQVVAIASGTASQPYIAETCPVQCIALSLSQNGSQNPDDISFIADKGTAETVAATAVDVQGCIVPKPPLTWTSSSPAALSAGSATTGCLASSSCTIATTQPGGAAITASCTPPTCNIGFPLNAPSLPALYLPQPVYPVTAISGLVTGATSSTNVLASSQDCYSNALCTVALYNISTSANIAGSPAAFPTPPNSLMFDPAGDKAYAGSQYGSLLITVANLGSSSTSPFTPLPATNTALGLVTGKVIAVSPNGNLAVFADTISTPNQVYVVNNSVTGTTTSGVSTTALNINSATTAAVSPDNSKAFILGNGGNTLYVYSPLQALKSYPLTAPANAIAFSSSGAFAFLAGGNSTGSIDVLNTCNNLAPTITPNQTLSLTGLPATPLFLKMVPPGNVPQGSVNIPLMQQTGASFDFFYGLDNTGIDIIATATTTPLTPTPASLCPLQTIAIPQYLLNNVLTPFTPIHINLQKGTFHPINFFVSPDASQVYIITSDQGVLVYNFSSQAVSAIPLVGTGNPAPVAADITADGTLLYVAGTDGVLHKLNTLLALDVTEIPFFQLANSSNNFCYSSFDCALDLVAVKP